MIWKIPLGYAVVSAVSLLIGYGARLLIESNGPAVHNANASTTGKAKDSAECNSFEQRMKASSEQGINFAVQMSEASGKPLDQKTREGLIQMHFGLIQANILNFKLMNPNTRCAWWKEFEPR